MALNIDGLASSVAPPRHGKRGTSAKSTLTQSRVLNGLASALDQLGIVSIADANGRILHVNDEFVRVSKYQRDELIGRTHAILKSAHHSSDFWSEAYQTLACGLTWRAPLMNRAKDGVFYWVDALIIPLKSRNRIIGYLSIQTDVTEVAALRAQLHERDDVLQAIVNGFPGGVAAFDKSHHLILCNEKLKELFDYPDDLFEDGQPTLEQLYRRSAERGEYGPGNTEDIVRSRVQIEKNRNAQTTERRRPDGTRLEIRCIPLPDGGFVMAYLDISGRKHDEEMKLDPPGSFDFYEPPTHVQPSRRFQISTELRESIANNRFDLHYQPIVNIKTRRIVGCEALIRWSHPKHGLVPASEFIPVAEEYGLIGQIGDWVLKAACAEARQWPDDVWIAVNISAAQFNDPNLVDKVVSFSKGLPLSRLVLEITETLLMKDRDAAALTLNSLKKLGVRFAIDDFGTGFSSLSYLQSFPFDKVKIDRSFVSNISNQKRSSTLRRSIIQLGYNLAMTSVAEGVETEQQLDLLRAEGCVEAQGFLFSPAVSAETVRDFFSKPF
jgi:PAS domain S-box-containing protein